MPSSVYLWGICRILTISKINSYVEPFLAANIPPQTAICDIVDYGRKHPIIHRGASKLTP